MNQPRMPSPAILVAGLALVAALAGTAVAGPGASTSKVTKSKVKKIANKQIDKRLPWETADIAPDAVTSGKIAPDAVTSGKIAPDAVTSGKIADASVNSAKVEDRSLRATDYSVFNGTENIDLTTIAANSCTTSILSVPGIRETDLTIVPTPSDFSGGGAESVIVSGVSGTADSLRWRNCNVSASQVNPPATTFSYVVLRP
jgi:hypothetical protein